MSNVFQLSALSQNDFGAADGADICCTITAVTGGTLTTGSFPFQKLVKLPVPPPPPPVPATPPSTPTWFLQPTGNITDTSYTLEIGCPSDSKYPTATITVTGAQVQEWGQIPYPDRPNQIYQKGVYGIFGFAQVGPDGLIYTVTVGVLNPQEHP